MESAVATLSKMVILFSLIHHNYEIFVDPLNEPIQAEWISLVLSIRLVYFRFKACYGGIFLFYLKVN